MSATTPLEQNTSTTVPLAERDQKILTFERSWWRFAGAKEEAIASQFQLTATRYYQILNSLLDDPAALEFDPILVKRLRRMRDSRRGTRTHN